MPRARPVTGRWAGLAALLAGFFVILLDTTIVAVASPRIQQDLRAGVAGVFWVTAGYLLAFSVPLLVAGRLGDRYDPKRVFLAGMAGFAVASALCGVAPSIGWLVLLRVVQGLAAAAMAPQPLTLIRRLFGAGERGRALGLWGTVASAGALLGPLLGGVLTAALDWRWVFLVNVPLCGAALLLGLRWIPGSPGRAAGLDLPGALLSTAGLGLLVWALLAWRDLPAAVIAAACGPAAVLLVAFVARERRLGPVALTPPAVLRSPGFRAASVAVAALGTVVIASALPAMLYLQEVRGLGPLEAALVMAPDAVIAALLSPAGGRWVDRAGPRRPAVVGLALLTASMLLIGLVVVLDVHPWWSACGAAVLGAANAVAWSPLSVAAMAAVDPSAAGAASGMFSTIRQVAAVTGAAVTGAVLTVRPAAPIAPFAVVFALMALIAAAGVAAAVRLPRTR
ncbi:MFS transporter [Dactylosporangium matsuzakiense]|uniref:MFS transporter n=1 Tax=Dactylosporangium matsuzakiense TaxID=53360 RepID=A0A9W6KHU4_9ACTN|nr:MFS transporter [Dactylosporangium matsuzakiense]UWZ46643.1 MFS transporter [Dactylosporangium matsuzakiense]GLL01222.1 MFS transporter [Dactylosporangium matsuzakiense]